MERILRILSRAGFLMIVVANVTFAQLASASQQISIRALGLGRAIAINNRGQVVAFAGFGAYVWQNGTTTNLLPPGFSFPVVPVAINDRGQVTGSYHSASHPTRSPFLWQDGVLTDLGLLPGSTQCFAGSTNAVAGSRPPENSLNDRGQVVGTCFTPDSSYSTAFLWQDGTMTDLRTGPNSAASAINNRGQVVGGFLWQDGALMDLRTLPGENFSYASAINERGQVVGTSGPEECPDNSSIYCYRAFLWQHGVLTDLGTLPGDVYSEPIAINDRGQVIGLSIGSVGNFDNPRAFLWQHGTMTNLGNLGGDYSYPYAINDRGQVVGISSTLSGERHAFLWQDGTMTDLGTLPGDNFSLAEDINERGQIVGLSLPSNGGHAVLWEVRGGMHGEHSDGDQDDHSGEHHHIGEPEEPTVSGQE